MSFLSALSLGTDSLIVSAAVAPLVRSQSTRLLLAALFGLSDGTATWLGAEVGWHIRGATTTYVEVAAVLLYGAYVLIVARWGRTTISRWPIWIMPLLMSVDNLSYGLAIHHGGSDLSHQVVVLTLASAAMSLAGLAAGGWVSRASGGFSLRTAGVALVISSAVLLLT